jgi:hypothetical protein
MKQKYTEPRIYETHDLARSIYYAVKSGNEFFKDGVVTASSIIDFLCATDSDFADCWNRMITSSSDERKFISYLSKELSSWYGIEILSD